MSGTKGKPKQGNANPFELGKEAVRSLGEQVAQETIHETQKSAQTFIEQLLGLDLKNNAQTAHGDNQEKPAEAAHAKSNHIEIFDSAKHHGKAEKAPKPRIEAALDYHGDM